jgi:hypothetical protein
MVSTHITGNINKLIIGINNKMTHQVGLFNIFKSTIALYTGIIASQDFLPAFTYNFHVPAK